MTTLTTIKTTLDKLAQKATGDTHPIVVCWCEPGKPCPHHVAHPNAPGPTHIYTVAGIDLESDI